MKAENDIPLVEGARQGISGPRRPIAPLCTSVSSNKDFPDGAQQSVRSERRPPQRVTYNQ